MTNLTNSSILDLWQNSLSGIIPPGMANLEALTEFVLFENHFTGTVPGNSGKDCNLTRFDASTSLMCGPVPVHLCDGQQLTQLIFFNNMFSGTIPDAQENCRTLTRVHFPKKSEPRYDAKLLCIWEQLVEYHPSTTEPSLLAQRAGSKPKQFPNVGIPPALGNGTQLKTQNLSMNFLTGPIPSELSKRSSLALLDLSHNALTGEVRSVLNGLSLEILEVS
ncbi:unnamed protein product [Sphagnum balticum]